MRKISKIICGLLVGIFSFGIITPTAQAAVTNQSIAIPVYQYPTLPFWTDINSAGSQVPFVVVNPASGPGVAVDPNYTNQIATNTTAGQRSIGYVDTNYQARSIASVIADIQQWKALYPGVTGFMLDRVSTGSAADLFYSAYIYNYIKVKYPNDLVVHNFGTYTNPQYEPYGDIFINAEMNYALYDSSWTVPADGFQDNPTYQDRFWHILHTTDSTDFAAALAKTRASNAGWVYITDDVMPNPYDDTPTYWATELTDVATLPQTVIPNRGLTQLPNTDLILTPNVVVSPTLGGQQNTYNTQISLTNTSTTYTAVTPTKVSVTLPTGVTLASASGTNWTCVGNECTYSTDLATGATTSVLNASFSVDCSYTSGSIGTSYSIFAGNTVTEQIQAAKPSNCASAPGASGSESGSATGGLAATGQNKTVLAVVGVALIAVGGYVIFLVRRSSYRAK